eukprot:6234192-Prymnesium_polylepis.1
MQTNTSWAYRCGCNDCCGSDVPVPGLWYEKRCHDRIKWEHEHTDGSTCKDVFPLEEARDKRLVYVFVQEEHVDGAAPA